jgi:hypothetical protein
VNTTPIKASESIKTMTASELRLNSKIDQIVDKLTMSESPKIELLENLMMVKALESGEHGPCARSCTWCRW